MAQLGCLRASATLTSLNLSIGQSRKAPPDAVRIIRFRAPGGNPCKHWKIAVNKKRNACQINLQLPRNNNDR